MKITISGNVGYFVTAALLVISMAVMNGVAFDMAFLEKLATVEGLMFALLVAGEVASAILRKAWDILTEPTGCPL